MLSAQGVARRAAAPVVRAGTSRMMVRVSASKQKVSSGGAKQKQSACRWWAQHLSEVTGPESQLHKSVPSGLHSYNCSQQRVIGQPGRPPVASCSTVVSCGVDERHGHLT